MDYKTSAEAFFENEIWLLTFGGAFQRADVYRNDASETTRRKFRSGIKDVVRSLVAAHYATGAVDSETHIANIEGICRWASREFSSILRDGRLRFGIAQKLLNLHLKYLWCWGKIQEPPHCPFDRTIIAKLGMANRVNWTEMDNADAYRKLVERALVKAGGSLSLAQWELTEFRRIAESS